jgi:hypothetical protein
MKTNQFAKLAFSGATALPLNGAVRLWLLGLVGLALLSAGCATTPVPTDPVKTGCSVSASEFNTWFETGAVSLDGVATPADSVNFSDNPNCDFYKWAEQMFVWLNSPAPPSYGGGGGRIFNSPAFYDVSPLDSNLDRTFIPHPSGSSTLGSLSLRAAQVGQHGLQVITDRRGTVLEIERPQFGPTGKQLILSESGISVEIERTAMGDNKKPIFFDKAGKVIQGAKPLIRKDLNQELTVQRFTVDDKPVFLNTLGNVVDVDQAEADGAILMAQNGSLVYYGIAVNDVYAYFLTRVKNGPVTLAAQFPTTAGELAQIKQFAITPGGKPSPDPFPDSRALAIEVKTAWVEAAGLANPTSYITMTATIPTYDQNQTTHPGEWILNGQKTVQMALVGMHVVGSTAGHPEMIWATFEHKNNAPNATYTYDSTSSTTPVTVNPDFSAAYLFCASNPDINHLNKPHMGQDSLIPANIAATSGFSISPSNTIRGNAWGAVAGVLPNPADTTVSASNSELISINNDVRGFLNSADVRNNYIMTGATWTINGAGPLGNFGNPGNVTTADGTPVGTSQLANLTMETYQQKTIPTSFDTSSNNCFSCHGKDGKNTTTVSHIFFTPVAHMPVGTWPHGLKPLF